MDLTAEKLAKMIDHTRLKADTKPGKIDELCEEALSYEFATVCINSVYVEQAAKLLQDSDVLVCCVVGFPLGASITEVKALEAKEAVRRGAREIDMVVNVGALRDGNDDLVRSDIEAVVVASGDAHVKVILETGLLIDEQKVQGCILSKEAGAHFVKTSTGFGPMGANPHDVRLMRETVGKDMGVKAAGGIRTFKDALRVIDAGADRIGTSAGVAIIEDFRWAQYSDSWMQPDRPCWICPSRAASLDKQPKDVYLWYKQRCLVCPDRDENIFND
ncbi:MAG: deoxyribose-phosphate aldolase [Candidatus Thorarchaeota archaeon]|nr:MAG: deoxyribose-phosphate aldolase [Candidatus Thorarchaeota archaeon]